VTGTAPGPSLKKSLDIWMDGFERGPYGTLRKGSCHLSLPCFCLGLERIAAGHRNQNSNIFQGQELAAGSDVSNGATSTRATPFSKQWGRMGGAAGRASRRIRPSASREGCCEVYERNARGRSAYLRRWDVRTVLTNTSRSREAHSLLLARGLIRIGIHMPVKPQFTIAVVHGHVWMRDHELIRRRDCPWFPIPASQC